jgi:hypothetical protein
MKNNKEAVKFQFALLTLNGVINQIVDMQHGLGEMKDVCKNLELSSIKG